MKIRKLKIKNYKVFNDVEFDFTDNDGQTLDTVVLAGVNGCGKTTVLELITTLFLLSTHNLSNEIDIELVVEIPRKKGFPEISLGDKDKYYENSNISGYLLDTKSLQSFFRYYLFPNYSKILGGFAYLPIKKVNNVSKLIKPSLPIYLLHLDSHKSQMEKSVLRAVQAEVYKNRTLTLNDSIQKSIEKISHVLRGLKLSTRLVDLDNEALIFESANGQRITFEDLSNGEQNLYFRAIQLSHLDIKNGLILIDEPEDALHPTWQKEVAKLYQNVGENNQVIMATHSPHVMASVEPKSLFVLHINETTRKVEIINMEKAGKHTKGLEPNRILREVMELDILRDYEIQCKIDNLSKLLTINDFNKIETQELIEELTNTLGKEDPFIMRMEHQLLMLNRQKMKLADAVH